jgi:serine/threonine-protein kinase
MPARVTLTVTKGKLEGEEFVFGERTTCIVGRADDCSPRVPNDRDHKTISRHHCLLDINPPDIRVRDFGSLNGTRVNGQRIGKREKHQTPEEAAQVSFPEYDLKEGDQIKLGNTVFRVGIFVPEVCAECAREIPEEQKAQIEQAPGVYRCAACFQKAESTQVVVSPGESSKVCAECGRDVSGEMGEGRRGEFICAACQKDPMRIVKHLLELANSGTQDLQIIQGYSLLKELGRGGMGAVYLARHDRTREVENTKALRHRHVVELRDSGCSHGTFFFTLEYCDGGSVADLVRERGGPLPIDEAEEIVLQALDGLEYAHTAEVPFVKRADGSVGPGRGLVHRDLKPGILFLAGSGRSRVVKVADFGLAKAFDLAGLSGQTRTGAMAGTPRFLPRQQVLNFEYAQPEVDVWAMAASLYFLLTGAVPRDFRKGADPWFTVLQTDAVPIRRRNASIPQRLAEVIDHALIDRPGIPFKTATDFKRALEDVL